MRQEVNNKDTKTESLKHSIIIPISMPFSKSVIPNNMTKVKT